MPTAADFVTALHRNDSARALAIARDLLTAGADLGDQWQAIARFAAHVGEWSIAISAARRFLKRLPNDPDRALFAAEILAAAGRVTDAVALSDHYARTQAGDARFHHLSGTAKLELGDTQAGLGALYRAVSIWPHSGITWLAIAGATDYAQDAAAVQRLEAAFPAMAQADVAANAAYLYALGKSREDRRDSPGAFAAYSAGARLIRRERPYDRAADLAEARAAIDGLDAGWLDRSAWDGPTDEAAPIFITGLPRSGTTLVEQILASHSRVSDGGEINLLRLAADRVGGSTAADLRRRRSQAPSNQAAWQPARDQYLHLLSERVPAPGRALDKSLNTSRYAGLLRLALPDAPVIWLRRDPADVAWSAFRTFFASGLGWSFDLADIGHHFAVEDMLFAAWQRLLGDRLLVVPYDDLVRDAGSWIEQIIIHCGLEMEPQVLRFHETHRAVKTASVAQVRRPIYRDALGASSTQAAALAPFFTSYAAARAALSLD